MDEKGRASTMPTEQTPLLQSVPVAEPRARYPHGSVRRFCTIALATIPLLTLVIIFLCITIAGNFDFLSDHETEFSSDAIVAGIPHKAWPESEGISYKELKHILLDTPDADKAREWSKYYTSGPHLAGKNLSQAEWTKDRWLEFGVDSAEIAAYDVYINYPLDHRLALLENGEVKYEASLEEDILEEDPTTGLADRVPTFHGYSANGDVTAPFVFCNYGSFQDFEDLQKAGIALKGKIALVKYGSIFRGLKVKRASELGMVGVVIYSDPGDDGDRTEENGFKAYPDGPARNPSSVQRGSCQYLSLAPGDPTTVGYASKPGVPRQSVEGKIPDIPSIPISYADALPLLKALNGHGPNASSFNKYWQQGGLGYKGVHYNIGPSPDSLEINLMNLQEYVTNPLWNVIGVINGTLDDEVVIIGNHRDAWIAGGAGDPNSGSAALNEIVRSFGKALKAGWRPQRTIVFASWDGEEYGLVGSTEWVEDFVPWLSNSTIAYVNTDVAARGSVLKVSAGPVLNQAFHEIATQVQSPNQTVPGSTVADVWDGHISSLGSGSDFTAFQDFAGISSIDLGYGEGPQDPVYHYHSNFDSFHWQNEFGDPGFTHQITVARLAGLLVAKLAEEPLVPFNATTYAFELESYLDRVRDLAPKSSLAAAVVTKPLKKLYAAVRDFQDAAVAFDAEATKLAKQLASAETAAMHDRSALHRSVRKVNQQYKFLERQFVYAEGLDGRSWFKHVVYAPGLWTGYAGATFPGLVEALTAEDDEAITRWSKIILERIEDATKLLSG